MSFLMPWSRQRTDVALDRVITRVRSANALGNATVAVAFRTVQAAQHVGRSSGYVNTVLSVRVGSAVGSCAAEPGELDDGVVRELVGREVSDLLEHPVRAVRVAVLDAHLADGRPHWAHPSACAEQIPPGTSLDKSMARARAVAGLVPRVGRVAVLGVVNSLLAALHEREIGYAPCDLKGGSTEWGEDVLTDHRVAIEGADAVLASGMVLGNGTFDDVVELCRERELPLVVFAQTGGAVFREMLGREIAALSAEPYPFFWLSAEATDIHLYPGGAS